MSFFSDLLDKPASPSTASKYSVMNGYLYLAFGIGAWVLHNRKPSTSASCR